MNIGSKIPLPIAQQFASRAGRRWGNGLWETVKWKFKFAKLVTLAACCWPLFLNAVVIPRKFKSLRKLLKHLVHVHIEMCWIPYSTFTKNVDQIASPPPPVFQNFTFPKRYPSQHYEEYIYFLQSTISTCCHYLHPTWYNDINKMSTFEWPLYRVVHRRDIGRIETFGSREGSIHPYVKKVIESNLCKSV